MNVLAIINTAVNQGRVYLGESKLHPNEHLFSVVMTDERAEEMKAMFGGEIMPKTNAHYGVEWRLTGNAAFSFADMVYPSLDTFKRSIVRSWRVK